MKVTQSGDRMENLDVVRKYVEYLKYYFGGMFEGREKLPLGSRFFD